MVRLQRLKLKLDGKIFVKVSIPLWFDYNLLLFPGILNYKPCLNSTMVRLQLELFGTQAVMVVLSQFHYGSITT